MKYNTSLNFRESIIWRLAAIPFIPSKQCFKSTKTIYIWLGKVSKTPWGGGGLRFPTPLRCASPTPFFGLPSPPPIFWRKKIEPQHSFYVLCLHCAHFWANMSTPSPKNVKKKRICLCNIIYARLKYTIIHVSLLALFG